MRPAIPQRQKWNRWQLINAMLQSAFRTVPDTFKAKNAFGTVFPLPGIVGHIHIHGTDLPAFSAGNTFFLIAFDPEQ